MASSKAPAAPLGRPVLAAHVKLKPWRLRPRRLGFLACSLADLLFVLDTSMRWFASFDFLRSSLWWRAMAPTLLACVVWNFWHMRPTFRPRPSSVALITVAMVLSVPALAWGGTAGLLSVFAGAVVVGAVVRPLRGAWQGLAAAPLLSCALILGSSGCGWFDWRSTPLTAGIFTKNLLSIVTNEFAALLSVLVVHGLWGWFVRREQMRATFTRRATALLVMGLSARALGRLGSSEQLKFYELPSEPNGTPHYLQLPALRWWFWEGLGQVGLALIAAGLAVRVAYSVWLLWVARGRSQTFALRPALPEEDAAATPVFVLVPFRKRRRLLVRRVGELEQAIARVLG